MTVDEFVSKWEASGGNERANTQLFVTDLCNLLSVDPPQPTFSDVAQNNYVFERNVVKTEIDGTSSNGWIDCYKRDCFILEAKQGSDADRAAVDAGEGESRRDLFGQTAVERYKRGMAKRGTGQWTGAMQRAAGQAEGYAKALPQEHGWPPFLLVSDIGYCIDIYADFQRNGRGYSPFPDRRHFRITLADLRDIQVRKRLADIWQRPLELDPSAEAARVTREIASHLATLARNIEAREGDADRVASFLMRLLFTMFAEDTGLIPKKSFSSLLKKVRDRPENLPLILGELWAKMDTGGFVGALGDAGVTVRCFNGYLFKEVTAIELTTPEIDVLIEAAKADWRQVEPAIFGTLLERALVAKDRAKLGAHYTPRAYVERLVGPTIIEPLREDWLGARTAATEAAETGDKEKALRLVEAFHLKLTQIKVLDPACGTGNFLYVAMARMKELEGEVLELLEDLGDERYLSELGSHTITPENFLGIEINPRAAAIAQLVLWIGYLQWHFRVNGQDRMPEPPVLRDVRTIENRDALITWNNRQLELDENNRPITRWDGETLKRHPITGREVPDEAAQVELWRYVNPKPASWPNADFIIGNPPFIGVRKIKQRLGEQYVEAIRTAFGELPGTVDFVMYWWHHAASLVRENKTRRFGLITTNSIVQDYSRPVVETHINAASNPLQLIYAVTNHPWVENKDGAAVDVAMTVGARAIENVGARITQVIRIRGGYKTKDVGVFRINAALKNIPDVFAAKGLRSNEDICFQGVVPAGEGFKIIDPEHLGGPSSIVRPYMIGDDLTNRMANQFIVDFYGLSEADASQHNALAYSKLLDEVKPERDQNPRESYKQKWWIFAEPRPMLRKAIEGLPRYIATPYTARHRPFVFLEPSVVPDAMIYVVASSDAYLLGVLSSNVHHTWCRYAGGTLQDRPRYNSNRTFLPFPFPDTEDASTRDCIRENAEKLDKLRKEVLAGNDDLTLTKIYNVLDVIREAEANGTTLTEIDRDVAARGCVSLIRQYHESIDAAVLKAYDFPTDLTDEDLLRHLIATNQSRAAEEAKGNVKWIRREFQMAARVPRAEQVLLELSETSKPDASVVEWPKALADQVVLVAGVVDRAGRPIAAIDVASKFKGKRASSITPVLDALAGMGRLRKLTDGRYAA